MATRKTGNEAHVQEEIVTPVGSNTSSRFSFDTIKDWIEDNQQIAMYIGGGLIALVALWFGYKKLIAEPNAAEAMGQMFYAERAFERDSFDAALNGPAGGFAGFLKIIDEYGSTPSGNMARYYAGASYLNLNKYDEAIQMLEDFDADEPVFATMKNGMLGDAYSEKKDNSSALSYYKKAANSGDNTFLTPYYMKKYALFSELQGDKETATKVFKDLFARYPDSPEGKNAERNLAKLGATLD
jgi:tetratricopeptide (TPR) repeat protein